MAADVNNSFLKKRVFKGLNWNVDIQHYLKRRSYINQQRLKSECLLLLRYSTTKSKLLRDTYYDYVVDRSRCLASQSLQLWLSKSIRKIVSRDHLQHKIEHFQKRRFFMTMNGIKARKQRSLQIINTCQALKWRRVFSQIIKIMSDRVKSVSYQNKKKAQHFQRHRILTYTYRAIQRTAYLMSTQKKILAKL